MKKQAIITLCMLLSGCVAHPGVVSISPDIFMVSLGDATGFSDLDTLKADAFQEADLYCTSQNKNIRVVDTTESAPPYILGNFPRVKIQFMCLEKADDEGTDANMQKQPEP